ncbi:hypothetical protein CYY_002184 [Polysphondylium violaceum]|uniref:Eukaryotic translation initiation factor 4E n=1 Tax=Polysphondylium violaceum TaxID=133409 RepID=A0A8J4PYU8_9MYCE|nr:hypothetical protein CYY_002184 [Polysphondylium violaceum]
MNLSYTDQMEIQAKSQKPTQHRLDCTWTFYTDKKQFNTGITDGDYMSTLTNIGSFSSVEDFWSYYHKLQRPSRMQADTTYHLFKSGVNPIWEDPENINGGKWVINFTKQNRFIFNIDLIWEDIVLGIVGETIDTDRDICGVVFSKREQIERIAIWNKDCSNEKNIEALKTNLLNAISGGGMVDVSKLNIRYQSHSNTLNSSTTSAGSNTGGNITPSTSSTNLSAVLNSSNSTTPIYNSSSNTNPNTNNSSLNNNQNNPNANNSLNQNNVNNSKSFPINSSSSISTENISNAATATN